MGKVNGTFEIDTNIINCNINNAIQKSISNAISNLNIKERVEGQANRVMKKHVEKMIENGSFYDSIAKNLVTKIDISKIIEMIDMNELKVMIAERVSQKIVEKMK